MEEGGITDENVESKDAAFIEIMGEQDLFRMPCHFKRNHPNVLRIFFDDVDEVIYPADLSGWGGIEPLIPMTPEQGREIFNFIVANAGKAQFVVHCAAGISRSGAVAQFITEHFGGSFADFKKLNYWTHPNQRILNILRKLSGNEGPNRTQGSGATEAPDESSEVLS